MERGPRTTSDFEYVPTFVASFLTSWLRVDFPVHPFEISITGGCCCRNLRQTNFEAIVDLGPKPYKESHQLLRDP